MTASPMRSPRKGNECEAEKQPVGEPREAPSPYMSPRELAERWRCSRTTAQRIADRAGLSKYFLGEGRNGMVRYAVSEVKAFELSRRAIGLASRD